MKKPVIGIVAKHYKKDQTRLETFIRDEIEQAIFDNGGIAIGILPPNEDKVKAKNAWYEQLTTTEKHNLYDQIALCDGIILQGGAFADEYECFIAKYCYDYDIPILGICAGKHNMVRAVGGKIFKMDTDIHQSEEEYVHKIVIDKNSKFYKIIGKEEIMVNSRHMCSSSDVGALNVVAKSPDGIDEVVEDRQKKFYLAVQFHPESLYKKDENINKIFKSFIDTCIDNKIYEDLKNPEELLEFMNNINYGFQNSFGVRYESSDELNLSEWNLSSPEDLVKTKLGLCFDQVELERKWFINHGYNIKTFFIAFALEYENNYPTHTFLAYQENDKWYLFENADYNNRGIHEYNSLEELIIDEKKGLIDYSQCSISIQNTLKVFEYNKPKYGIHINEYIEHVTKNEI